MTHGEMLAALDQSEVRRVRKNHAYPWAIVHVPSGLLVPVPAEVTTHDPITGEARTSHYHRDHFRLKREAQDALTQTRQQFEEAASRAALTEPSASDPS